MVKKLGGFVIAENVNETTTHVICGEPRRTLNVLQCVARGAWLLNKSWVRYSIILHFEGKTSYQNTIGVNDLWIFSQFQKFKEG